MKFNPILLVGGLFAFVGSILFLFGVFMYQDNQTFARNAERTNGQVIDLASFRSKDGGRVYSAVVRYQVHGQDLEFTDSFRSNPAMHKVGDQVEVMFDPRNPSNARIDSSFSSWFAIVFTAIGGFFGLFGIGFMLKTLWSKSLQQTLKTTGVEARGRIIEISLDRSFKFNNRSPYIVRYQFTCPLDGKVYVGVSNHFWFDPVVSGHLQINGEITVRFDPKNPRANVALLDEVEAAAG